MSPLNREQPSAIGSEPLTACGRAAPTAPDMHSAGAASPARGKLYWRSLDDLADSQEFRELIHREFPVPSMHILDSADRRQFLKVMGASMALAGFTMTGCRRWPQEHIAPYAHRPAGHNPGSTDQFATCMELAGVAQGLLVTSYDYRPIKVDGNPLHPINGNAADLPADLSTFERARQLHGASDAFAQASILDLYDPDRSQGVMRREGEKLAGSSWGDFSAWARPHLAAARASGGAGLAILSEATGSPSVLAMKQRLLKTYPRAAWHEYEPINNDNQVRGTTLAFGAQAGGVRPVYAFHKARIVVALDSDFLHCDGGSIKWTRDFARSRREADRGDQGRMSRLYAFEAMVSLTGINADHRVSLRSADVAVIAARLAAELVPGAAAPLAELARTSIEATTPAPELEQVMASLIEDLKANRGRSIIIAGPRQPAEVHLLVHMLNQALGNIDGAASGRAGEGTIRYVQAPQQAHAASLAALAQAIDAGAVNTLVIIGGNPVYNAPADLQFVRLLAAVPVSIHLSDYVDETSLKCTWHVNRAHYLEAWGDGRAADGAVTIAQPLIEPLFAGKSAIELLALINGDDGDAATGQAIVRRTFGELEGISGEAIEHAWRRALHDGVLPESAAASARVNVAGSIDLAQHAQALMQRGAAANGAAVEVIFAPDLTIHDGRYANNGWLQEMPDPITTLTWDNAALISPAAAARRGLRTGDMVTIRLGDRSVDAAIMELPGQHEGSVTLTLGYGREFNGRICAGAGFNFYRLRTSQGMSFAAGATLSKIAGHYKLATTQDHHAVNSWPAGQGVQERLPSLFREASLKEYQDHPRFVEHRTHVVHRLSLWEEKHPFQSSTSRPGSSHAWGMAIDLNSCTGCSACVIACQAENNVPIVGKEQVINGREMHWLRVDRYFKGGTEALPAGYTVAPVPCMHCENAPCEQVCPVAATVHDADGLNVMVYNRCVGTRYCSNNCPYKVRRFNYFDFHRRAPHRERPGLLLQVEPEYYTKPQTGADPLRRLQFNPEVTVRMRGIMEKCTYCVQRITTAKIEAKNQWVRENPEDRSDRIAHIPDGTIVTACAQACPAQAIVFGDLNDPDSRVAQLHKHNRSYEMLEELNTKPRTRYMAKIRNPAFGKTEPGHEHG